MVSKMVAISHHMLDCHFRFPRHSLKKWYPAESQSTSVKIPKIFTTICNIYEDGSSSQESILGLSERGI